MTARQRKLIAKLADLIEQRLAYTNGWRVDDLTYRADAEEAAQQILTYLGRSRQLREIPRATTRRRLRPD